MQGLRQTFCSPARALLALLACMVFANAAQATCTLGSNDIKATRSLSFGPIVSGPAGSVTMAPDGGRTASGAVILTSTQFGTVTSAEFTVCSGSSDTATITLPTADITLTRTGGGSMTVGSFTRLPAGTLTVSDSTRTTLNVGATLTVGSNQLAGSYTGNFTITVDYP